MHTTHTAVAFQNQNYKSFLNSLSTLGGRQGPLGKVRFFSSPRRGEGLGARLFQVFVLSLLGTLVLSPANAVNLNVHKQFDIPAQQLSSALIDFGRQTNVQVMTASNDLEGLQASAVQGTMTLKSALQQLLAGTELHYEDAGSNSVTISKFTRLSSFAQELPKASVTFQIESQPLPVALNAFAQQTGLQVIFPVEEVTAGGAFAPSVVGTFTPMAGLERLLANSKLGYAFVNARTVAIRIVAEGDRGVENATSATQVGAQKSPLVLAQAEPNGEQGTEQPHKNDSIQLEEITVVGTRIRGVAPGSSPITIYSRADIDQAGVGSVQEFIQRLPQNFNGGLSESTMGLSVDGGAAFNHTEGTGINLRGLGNDSTLVLLNGRRLAPAGIGDFVDISMIPLTAIKQMQVLTDGASAIYGSDAIGGVVNFQLRDDYEGAETRLRYGTATAGSLDEVQIGQTFGTNWNTGHALLSYEFHLRDALDAADRSFSENAGNLHQLLPEQKRHSLVISADQDLTESIDIFADAFYSTRDSKRRSVEFIPGPTLLSLSDSEQYGGSLGSRVELGNNWLAELVGTYSRHESSSKGRQVDEANFNPTSDQRLGSWSVDGKADGSIIHLSGGDAKLALGGQFRRETIRNFRDVEFERDIFALFGELFVPFIGEDNGRPGLKRLELTVAGRYEEYDDFGSSANPKFGVLWSPATGVNLRGTYGTSFRAPLFAELDDSTAQGFLIALPNPSDPNGSTLSVLARGGNPELQPEEATTWTAGLDFRPSSLPGFSLDLTYFNIEFENRISRVLALFSAFTNPRFASLLEFAPDPGLLEFLGSQPNSQNFAPGFEFTDAEVIVDERQRNNASTHIRGLDFSASYTVNTGSGVWGFMLGGTRELEEIEQLLQGDETFDVLGTYSRPVALRMRGGLSWAHGGLASHLSVNYVDSYLDDRVAPAVGVDSWTTADLNVTYSTGDGESWAWLKNADFSLSALNLFDRDPPFVASNFGLNINYDPNTASPIGRFMSFQISKSW